MGSILLPHAHGVAWDAQATLGSRKIAFPNSFIPNHYRGRADAENCLDELKNQWGWGGFTSRKLASSRLRANLIVLFDSWWNLHGRFYDEEHHREAVRSRSMLMSGVGRQVQSGGQRTIKVSVLHEKGDRITQISKETSRCAPSRSDGPWSNAGRFSSRDSGGLGIPICDRLKDYG